MEPAQVNWKTTIVVCIAILVLAASVITVIHLTEPKAQRTSASKRTAMLVEVTHGEHGTFQPEILAMGSVRAAKEIVLSPRVSGEIASISESFTPGGSVEEGEVLLQIDPSDYEVVVLQRKSELLQASADLELELGRPGVKTHRLAGWARQAVPKADADADLTVIGAVALHHHLRADKSGGQCAVNRHAFCSTALDQGRRLRLGQLDREHLVDIVGPVGLVQVLIVLLIKGDAFRLPFLVDTVDKELGNPVE